MRLILKRLVSSALVLVAAVGALISADQPGAAGICVGNRPALVRPRVGLLRGAEPRLVLTCWGFVSGDKMFFQFANRGRCIYVLTRAVSGDGAAAQRLAGCNAIGVLRKDDLKAARTTGGYRLTFSLKKTGSLSRLMAGSGHIVPGNGTYVAMDYQPGLEKLYIVLSPSSVAVLQFFDLNTGNMLRSNSSASLSDRSGLAGLERQMSESSENSNTAIPEPGPKGITVKAYSVSANSARTALVEVDLQHRRS